MPGSHAGHPPWGTPRSPHGAPAIFSRGFCCAPPRGEGSARAPSGGAAEGGRKSPPEISVLHLKERWKGLWGEKVSNLFWLRLEKTSWEAKAAAKSRPRSGRNSRPLPEVPGGWGKPGRPARASPGHTRAPWVKHRAGLPMLVWQWGMPGHLTERPRCQKPTEKRAVKAPVCSATCGFSYTVSGTQTLQSV